MEKGSSEFGTRSEMKNVNSFSAAVRGMNMRQKTDRTAGKRGEGNSGNKKMGRF